jgi:hypothetical protein
MTLPAGLPPDPAFSNQKGSVMLGFCFGFLITTACYGALVYFGWKRVLVHLKGNAEASQAFTEHVLIPLFGRKESEAKKAGEL